MTEPVTCKAVAYQAGLPEGRAAGDLHTTDAHLCFRAASVSRDLPLDGLDVKFQGFNNLGATISHPSVPGLTLVCADASLLKLSGLASHPDHSRHLKRAARARRKIPLPVKFIIAFCVLVLAGLVTLWAARDRIVQAVVDKIPTSVEESIGDTIYTQYSAGGKLVDDPAYKAKLETAVGKLHPLLAKTPYSFRFHVVRDASLNAFACPGGEVFIHTGLLDAAKRPEEIAGVLGHEVAHVTRRHTLRNMVSSIGLGALLSGLLGDAAGLGSILTTGSQELLEKGFSRDYEREADDSGFDLLVEAGIDPSGMVDFFRRLKEEEKKGVALPSALSLLSTHPATDERIAHLEARMKELSGKTFVPLGAPTEVPAVEKAN